MYMKRGVKIGKQHASNGEGEDCSKAAFIICSETTGTHMNKPRLRHSPTSMKIKHARGGGRVSVLLQTRHHEGNLSAHLVYFLKSISLLVVLQQNNASRVRANKDVISWGPSHTEDSQGSDAAEDLVREHCLQLSTLIWPKQLQHLAS